MLAAAGDENDAQYNDDWSIRIYSLPGAGLLYTWPYSFSSYSAGTGAIPQDIELSGSGAVLGQVLNEPSGSYTLQANPATGGAAIFSTTVPATTSSGIPPVRISPDGTLIATSTALPSANSGTNILQNGNVITAVTGYPVGWIDDGDLLVNTFTFSGATGTTYAACIVYGPSGQSTGPCALPEVTAFQTVGSNSIYAVNLASILSVSTGNVSWTSGDSASQSVGGAVAGNAVVFLSGTQVIAQGY